MYRFVMAFLAVFGAALGCFAAPANVVSDSDDNGTFRPSAVSVTAPKGAPEDAAAVAATHVTLVPSLTGVENPDAYSSSPGISPEVLAYLGGGATKGGKGAGFSPEARTYLGGEATKGGKGAGTPGTGAENPDAYSSSHAISPQARTYLGGEAAAAAAAGQ
jgi:hypothetical protein